MLLYNLIWFAGYDTSLWTVFHAVATADTVLRDIIAFCGYIRISYDITFTKNRIDAKIEIFNFCIFDTEHNADFPCIVRINV